MLLIARAVGLTACGSDGGTASTVTTGPGSTSTGAPTVTTVTTVPFTTTTTTASPDDLHPAWPMSWAALWPADGSTATARAATGAGTIDTEAGMDYGVEWDGGTWDRIWLGSPEPEQLGVSFYLQRPEPWVIVLWGAETHASNGLYMTERFDPPLSFDLRMLPGEDVSGETTVVIADSAGEIERGAYTPTLSFVGFEAVEVAAGTFSNTAHLPLVAEEPGGFVAETDIWIDGEQALVRLAPAHVFDSQELAEPWTE